MIIFRSMARTASAASRASKRRRASPFPGSVSGQTLLQQPDQALTRDCINLCKQQAQCLAFSLNYVGFRCASFNLNSIGRRDLLVSTPSTNYFEKICFRGVQKSSFDALCGDRLWAFERVKEGHLEGFVDREEHNVKDKEGVREDVPARGGLPLPLGRLRRGGQDVPHEPRGPALAAAGLPTGARQHQGLPREPVLRDR
ncbi:hypothetical protein MRX96_003552 [Rhipicephalus microplus]